MEIDSQDVRHNLGGRQKGENAVGPTIRGVPASLNFRRFPDPEEIFCGAISQTLGSAAGSVLLTREKVHRHKQKVQGNCGRGKYSNSLPLWD